MPITVLGRLKMKILISHTKSDRPFAKRLSHALVDVGHDVISLNFREKSAGTSVLSFLEDLIAEAEVYVVIWSDISASSSFADREMLAIKMLVDTDASRYLIPVVLDDAKPPAEFSNHLVIRAKSDEKDLSVVLASISRRRCCTNRGLSVVPLSPDGPILRPQ
ncbi:toll/interleukin-1 receptor domain-containing protein [Pseudophaeobacter sp. C1-32P7]|uniref:toll/interleukin-1 receptor domain-containing protein n=1 Tax=Pseudophaeobacter sp. C1-32P7 TaxID=3098142 RepID=UPI0034D3F139